MTCVGLNTVPAWCRPFQCLSNGQQERVLLAVLRFLLTPRIRLVFNWSHSAVALLHEMFLVTYLYHPSCINVLDMKSFSQRILQTFF